MRWGEGAERMAAPERARRGWEEKERDGVGVQPGSTLSPKNQRRKIERVKAARIWPQKNNDGIEIIANGMWNNLGRVIGECPHLGKINVFT